MRRELYRVWIISHCCGKVSHKQTGRCFVLITMQVEAFLSAWHAKPVFQACFVHVFQTTTKAPVPNVVVWWLEDELMVVGGGYAALGGGAEGGESIARERHGPAQPAVMEPGSGMMRPGTPASRQSCSHSITSKVLSNETIILRSWSRASPDGPSRCASRYAAAAASSSAVCPQPPQPQVQGSEPSQVQGSPVSGQIS